MAYVITPGYAWLVGRLVKSFFLLVFYSSCHAYLFVLLASYFHFPPILVGAGAGVLVANFVSRQWTTARPSAPHGENHRRILYDTSVSFSTRLRM